MPDETVSASGPPWFPRRLGKLPASGTVGFRLASYIDLSLPEPPPFFFHPDPPPFYDYDNSKIGDCVLAGAANETALWMHEGGMDVTFTTEDVIAEYSTLTGFDPNRPETDKGTDVGEAAKYRRRVGIKDSKGRRQRIDAYAMLELGDFDKLKTAMWLLGGIGLGFRFPAYAMAQFQNGEPWSVQKWSFTRVKGWLLGSEIAGGHYVPAIGIAKSGNSGNIMTVSWGRVQEMTPAFFLKYADELVCYLDLDRLDRVRRKSPEGFNQRELYRDLAKLTGGLIYTKPSDSEYI